MKAKVIETGEIIDVQCLRPVIYSRLRGGKIIEEYEEDELEFLAVSNKPKMISLDKACKWLEEGGYFVNNTETIEDFRKAMDEYL